MKNIELEIPPVIDSNGTNGVPEAEYKPEAKEILAREPFGQSHPQRVSYDPATGSLLGHVPLIGKEGIEAAITASREAQLKWGKRTPKERAKILLQFRDALMADLDGVAELITREQGKPLVEAMSMEIMSVLAQLKWLTEQGAKILAGKPAPLVHPLFNAKQASYQFAPLGVIAIISPWNYPFSIPVIQMLTAFMAGNGVVLKPSPYVPLIGQKIAQLARQTELPTGLLHVIHVEDSDASYLTSHPSISKIIFTGSVQTGRKVMASAAQIPTPVVLELGGKDAAIVAADADLKRTVPGIVWYAMSNTGQTCASIERVYVHTDIYDRFVAQAIAHVKKLKVGHGTYQESQLGPLSNQQQLEIVSAQVEDAKAKGAHVLVGGYRLQEAGYFYAPTILANVTPEMRIMQEETFGPILPIIKVATLSEAMTAANSTKFGLTGSIWTSNKELGLKLAKQMRAGGVNINDHAFHFAEPGAAWGGIGESGFGRTIGEHGILEMVSLKYISSDMRKGALEAWWYPYNEKTDHFLRNAARLLYSPNKKQRLWALISIMLNPRTWQRVNLVRFAASIRKWL
jgi:succinate-semialdehyde dehydrogenase/glutarate-semialdehyde dehydrogenase